MNYLVLKILCRKAWKVAFIYLCIDRSKKEDKDRLCIFNESGNTYVESVSETEPFKKNESIKHCFF